jgi:hypothetical protein
MSPTFSDFVLSDLNIEVGLDKICDIDLDSEEPRIRALVAEATEMLEEWASDDEDYDLNINKDDDEQFGSNFFDEHIFDDDAQPPQEQPDTDSMDFDFDYLEKDDFTYFTCRVSPLSSQNFTFADNKYREAFKNLAESMKRSQETRASLKLRSPVKEAARHWEERRNNISTVLSRIEISSMHIQQTYFHTTHA